MSNVGQDAIQPAWSTNDVVEGEMEKTPEGQGVFKPTEDGVDFRTVSWQRATVIFLKINFAMSILAVPGSLGTLGAVGGALSIVGWEALNTCKHSSAAENIYKKWLYADPNRHCDPDRRLPKPPSRSPQ